MEKEAFNYANALQNRCSERPEREGLQHQQNQNGGAIEPIYPPEVPQSTGGILGEP
jgi:hypothetical protein